MLEEIVQPISLLCCILSLYALFHTVFLMPASDLGQRLYGALGLLVLYAGISVASGLLFRDSQPQAGPAPASLRATLPMQIFVWSLGILLVLLAVSWYVESYPVFYRDIRRW